MIKKEKLGKIIKEYILIYKIFPFKKIEDLIVELIGVWNMDKPNEIDLINAIRRAVNSEKKER